MVRRLRIGIALLALVTGLVFVGAAWAEDPSVIDQYQEPFPTGGGNHHTGGSGGNGDAGGSGGSGGQLPGSTQTNLESSVSAPVATALEAVATSAGLGAPQTTFAKTNKGSGENEAPVEGSPPAVDSLSGSPLTDAVSAAADGGSSHLLAVVLALVAITAGGAFLAASRRRHSGI